MTLVPRVYVFFAEGSLRSLVNQRAPLFYCRALQPPFSFTLCRHIFSLIWQSRLLEEESQE